MVGQRGGTEPGAGHGSKEELRPLDEGELAHIRKFGMGFPGSRVSCMRCRDRRK